MGADGRLRPETIAVKAGRGPGAPGDALGPPIVMASTFHAGGERAYARTDGTPTWRALEEAVGELEGGEAVLFSSGMAAVAAVLETLPVGARVVHPTVSYLGVRRLMGGHAEAGRMETTPVDVTDTDAVIAAAVASRSRSAFPRWSTTPSPLRSCSARWSWAATWSFTARRS